VLSIPQMISPIADLMGMWAGDGPPEAAVLIAPDCSERIEGIVNVTSTTLVGTASPRASTCASPLSVVNFALTKQ
jgi:hypothetical protein